ncbi:MAG TPA: TfoX/Sxy family protein [Cyclobacteriaceae bacterium]
MAYNDKLADRIRERLIDQKKVQEKSMMGGLVFMVNRKMCVGIYKDQLMCRVDPEQHEILVEKPGARTMDFTNRPMIGYILIDDSGMKSKKDFDYWIGLSLEFNKFAKSSKQKKKASKKKSIPKKKKK